MDLKECGGIMELKVNPRFVSGDFRIPFLCLLDVETYSVDDVYCDLEDLTIGLWGLDGENLHVIFDLRNKFFEGNFAGDGRFYPCVVCGIVMFVQFSVLYFDMGHDVDVRHIGVRGISVT